MNGQELDGRAIHVSIEERREKPNRNRGGFRNNNRGNRDYNSQSKLIIQYLFFVFRLIKRILQRSRSDKTPSLCRYFF